MTGSMPHLAMPLAATRSVSEPELDTGDPLLKHLMDSIARGLEVNPASTARLAGDKLEEPKVAADIVAEAPGSATTEAVVIRAQVWRD